MLFVHLGKYSCASTRGHNLSITHSTNTCPCTLGCRYDFYLRSLPYNTPLDNTSICTRRPWRRVYRSCAFYAFDQNSQDTFNTNYNSKSFIAATLLCAVVSALMAKIGLHDELSLRPAEYNLESPLIELPLYLGLGVVAGLVAVMFKYFSRKVCWW